MLGAARSGVRIPAGARNLSFFAEHLHLLWGPPSLLFKGHLGYLPGKSDLCLKFIIQLDLALKFRMSGAVPLPPLYVFMAWTEKTFFTFTGKCNH
jgi:hypothetical protein